MNRAAMRTRFHRTLGGALLNDPDFTDADVNEALNRAHQYTIPDRVAGEITEGIWIFDTRASQEFYSYGPEATEDLPNAAEVLADGAGTRLEEGQNKRVHSLKDEIIRDDTPIRFFTRQTPFWWWFRPNQSGTATPYAALAKGYELQLRTVPDKAYRMQAVARLYPVALTDVGLNDDTRALASVYLAAYEVASEMGLSGFAAKNDGLAHEKIQQLRGRSYGRPRTRPIRRSF